MSYNFIEDSVTYDQTKTFSTFHTDYYFNITFNRIMALNKNKIRV